MNRNNWEFSGELFRLNEFDSGEFGASLRIRGSSRRFGVATQICELTSLVPEELYYGEFRRRKVEQYDNITVQGHIETWTKERNSRVSTKAMFIVDTLVEVKKKGVRA